MSIKTIAETIAKTTAETIADAGLWRKDIR
jgi:hypothetical protein